MAKLVTLHDANGEVIYPQSVWDENMIPDNTVKSSMIDWSTIRTGTLTINADGETYEYDGSENVEVNFNSPVLLHIDSISDLENGGSIYSDSALHNALTKADMKEIIGNVGSNYDKAPREVWIMWHDSVDMLLKLVACFYSDLTNGFIVAGVGESGVLFYRISNSNGPDSTEFTAEKINIE
jgi:hypothetical protein